MGVGEIVGALTYFSISVVIPIFFLEGIISCLPSVMRIWMVRQARWIIVALIMGEEAIIRYTDYLTKGDAQGAILLIGAFPLVAIIMWSIFRCAIISRKLSGGRANMALALISVVRLVAEWRKG